MCRFLSVWDDVFCYVLFFVGLVQRFGRAVSLMQKNPPFPTGRKGRRFAPLPLRLPYLAGWYKAAQAGEKGIRRFCF
jgi:hypothetical protein